MLALIFLKSGGCLSCLRRCARPKFYQGIFPYRCYTNYVKPISNGMKFLFWHDSMGCKIDLLQRKVAPL